MSDDDQHQGDQGGGQGGAPGSGSEQGQGGNEQGGGHEQQRPASGAPTKTLEQLTEELSVVTRTLATEREERQKAQRTLAERERSALPEHERAVAEAKEAGRVEALQISGRKLAAAEFRAAAAGKLANVDAIIDRLDLTRFLTADGDVDGDAITATVGALLPPAPTGDGSSNGHRLEFPPGTRQSVPNPNEDWLRNTIGAS